MITTNIFDASNARKIIDKKGIFSVIEYEKDISVSPEKAHEAYFASKMEIRKRQVVAEISEGQGVIAQKGVLQFMLGNLEPRTGIQGVGDFMKKYVGSKVTKESAIKPEYTGEGILVLEPTYNYILLEDIDDWNGGLVVEDGMFLACQDSIELAVTARTNLSSAVLGGEGLFNTVFTGNGVIALESPAPRDELFEVELFDDVVKIDGNMAIAWSDTLEFTVERTTPTLFGSMAAGEGLVNVYRGTGKILIAPVDNNKNISSPDNKKK